MSNFYIELNEYFKAIKLVLLIFLNMAKFTIKNKNIHVKSVELYFLEKKENIYGI